MPLNSSRFKQFLNTLRGERIDQPDFQFAAETSQRDLSAQVGDGFLVGHDGSGFVQTRQYVLSGFLVSNPAATQLTITGGSAILSQLDNGVLINGQVQTGGDASKTVDISTYANGTYGIYVRMEMRESDYINRPFWNADAVTPVEYPRVMPTRLTEAWSVVVELVSPGPEWMRIYTVAKAGAVLTLTDRRDFFFEGRVDNSYDPTDEWGDSDDHSSTRHLFGVFGLRRFVRAMQTQLGDIIGGSWWTTVTGPTYKSLADLTADKLERDGSNTITGTILPAPNVTHELGGSSNRFLTIFTQDLAASGTVSSVDVTASDEVEGAGLKATANAPNPLVAADKGKIYKDMVPLAWFYAVTSGAGAFSSFSEVGCALTFNGTNVRVTLDNAATSTSGYSVVGHVQYGGLYPGAYLCTRISATVFDLALFEEDGAALVNLDPDSTANVVIDFHVYGRPA